MGKKGFFGIDVSKGYADFLLLDSNGDVMEESFQLTDCKQGRQKLKEIITGWQQQGLEELFCGVESTGGYENNWYSYLKTSFKDSKVYVCRINPRGVKSIGEASLKRTITDAVSAENIAAMDLSAAHWYATFFWPLHCVSAGSLEENPASSGGILQRRVPCRSPCEDGREVFAR